MINIINTALLLAAGFGKRLQPLTGDLPKPLVDINGRSALEIGIDGLACSSFCQQIVINTHWQSHQIQRFVDGIKPRIDKKITLIDEQPEILETGGGIMNAMQVASSQTLLIKNSDILFSSNIDYSPYQALIKEWQDDKMDALLLLCKKNRGDFSLSSDSKIVRGANNDYGYTGCCIISDRLFADRKSISSFSITEILFKATPQNYNHYNFYGLVMPDHIDYYDIGTPDNLFKARLRVKNYRNLW